MYIYALNPQAQASGIIIRQSIRPHVITITYCLPWNNTYTTHAEVQAGKTGKEFKSSYFLVAVCTPLYVQANMHANTSV